MTFGIVIIVFGAFCTFNGYRIKVQKKYDTVHDLPDRKRKEMDEEAYAERIGRRELLAGIACIVFGGIIVIGKVMGI